MPGQGSFEVEGLVLEALPNGTARVELANGHRLTAFVSGRTRLKFGGFKPGSRLKLQVWPGDLSQGKVLVDGRIMGPQSDDRGYGRNDVTI
ncbi:MAG: translation initiation factor IF-1 [Verrucomicrobiota bacterium]